MPTHAKTEFMSCRSDVLSRDVAFAALVRWRFLFRHVWSKYDILFTQIGPIAHLDRAAAF